MNLFFNIIRRSSGLYPTTAFWLIASGVAALLVGNLIGLGAALLILLISAVLAVLIAAWRELRTLHRMMDGQRTETLARLDQLERIINAHGWSLPPENAAVHEARAEAAEAEGGAV